MNKNQSVNHNDIIPWEQQTISNDFMFCKIMSDPILCRDTLRRILPELNIEKVQDVVAQKDMKLYYQNKGVRLDIYVIDNKERRFDIEMQLITNPEISKRSRYYSSMMDANELLKGQDYDQLSDSYVVFICLNDVFGKGLHKYVFKNICTSDSSIHLNDGSYKVFLNASGVKDDVDEDLKTFLDFIAGREVENDSYITKLQKAVEEARNNETWRGEYMTYRDIERRGFLQGEKAGIEKGRAEGLAEGKAEGKAEDIAAVKAAISSGIITEEAAHQILALMESNNNDSK